VQPVVGELPQPSGHLLAVVGRPVEVVVARGGEHGRTLGQLSQVTRDDDGLDLVGNGADHVGEIAGDHDRVHRVGRLEEPVVVR
jgi:hypothetical protein